MTNFILSEDGVRIDTFPTVEEAAEHLVKHRAYGRWEVKPTAGTELTMIERVRYYDIVGMGFRRELERRKAGRAK